MPLGKIIGNASPDVGSRQVSELEAKLVKAKTAAELRELSAEGVLLVGELKGEQQLDAQEFDATKARVDAEAPKQARTEYQQLMAAYKTEHPALGSLTWLGFGPSQRKIERGLKEQELAPYRSELQADGENIDQAEAVLSRIDTKLWIAAAWEREPMVTQRLTGWGSVKEVTRVAASFGLNVDDWSERDVSYRSNGWLTSDTQVQVTLSGPQSLIDETFRRALKIYPRG